MNRDKYEISIWEDYPVAEVKEGDVIKVPAHYEERKIAIIGSNTLSSPCRAYNPKLEQNINGTNTFSFEMFQTYRENFVRDGKDEILTNPFLALLSNERKIKVLWKNKWYDFVIKNISEDTSSRKNTYICQDLYINELSKNGFNLTFDSELGNNEGTAQELVEKVLEGTDWTLDKKGSQGIQQKKEEPVFEFSLPGQISAKNQSNPKIESTITINAGQTILLFYNQIQSLVEITTRTSINLQFAYAESYETETNSQLVTNADCYTATFQYTKDGNRVKLATSTNGTLKDLPSVVSNNYRAERLVLSKVRKFDPLTKKYCYVLKREGSSDEIYEFSESKLSDALSVQNLFVNSSDFTNSQGWERIGTESAIPLGIYKNKDNQYEKTYIRIYPKTSGSDNIYKNRGLLVNSVNIPEHGFSKGDKYIVKYRCRGITSNTGDRDPIAGSYTSETDLSFWVEDSKGTKYFGPIEKTHGSWKQDPLTFYWSIEISCDKSISKESIRDKKLFLCIQNNNTNNSRWLEDIQFFPAVYNEDKKLVEPDKFETSSVVQTIYKYYNHKTSQSLISADGIEYLYVGNTPWNDGGKLSYVNDDNFSKRRSISIKQSNRFNILQTIAEQFECWLNFNIEHDEATGKISYENGCPKKTVQIRKDVGIDTGVSFIYGIDLKSIQRTIQSDQIVSKTIVSANNNEFAKNGSCAISQSSENYPGVDFILNFDYYINQGLLDSSEINKDLYSSTDGIGYYFNLHRINSEYQKNAQLIIDKKGQLTHYTSSLKIFEEAVSSLTEQISDLQSDLDKASGKTTRVEIDKWISENLSSDYVWSCVNTLAQLNGQKTSYSNNIKSLTDAKQDLEKELKKLEENQKALVDSANKWHEKFYRKYSRFIQEGTWTSEDYIDETLYFLDAQSIAYTSSRPQIRYQIEVARLSGLEEFQNKIFNVGDIAYVQDPEFFGYTVSGNLRTPIKQPVVVSGVTSYFDEPSKDSFIVQNYKTQFEDLFQRITSTTQSLQYASGSYAKATNIINSDGTIKTDVLQSSFAANENLVYRAKNDTFVQDNTGITVSSLSNTLNKVRITSDGIFITVDGGTTWRSAVRGEGISTQYLTAGSINVGDIIIRDGNYVSFRWDSEGISAYAPVGQNSGGYDLGTFIRFDHYGLYGINGQSNFSPTSEDSIWDNASFGMTWKGFFLKNDNGSVCISSDNDIEVKKGNEPRIKIGRINNDSSAADPIYGIRISDGTSTVMETSDDGKLWLKNALFIGNDNNSKVQIGWIPKPQKEEGSEELEYKQQVINANNNFIVYEDGSLSATDAVIKGIITATSGEIGCLDVNENNVQMEVFSEVEENGSIKKKWSGSLLFDSRGLTITDGAFQIVSSQASGSEEEQAPLLYFSENQLNITGSGHFTGQIEAKKGTIGGFVITSEEDSTGKENNYLYSTDNIGGNPSIILNGSTGEILAEKIKIGTGAEISDFLKLGDNAYLYNSKLEKNRGKVLSINGKQQENYITLSDTGVLQLGNLTLDGRGSSIYGRAFTIKDDWAEFTNVSVSGKIVSTVFETSTVQAVGGSMIFKPSYKVSSATKLNIEGQKEWQLKLDFEKDVSENKWKYLIIKKTEGETTSESYPYILLISQGQQKRVRISSIDKDSNTIIVPRSEGEGTPSSIVVLGEDNASITTINSGDSKISDFGIARGITISTFKITPEEEENGVVKPEKTNCQIEAYLGDLSRVSDPRFGDSLKGSGLYSQNAFLTGSLVTQTKNGHFAGVNTSSNTSIVFWGGANDLANVSSAPFRVTTDGSLYAEKGVFRGIVEGAKIVTAKIVGNGKNPNPGLIIANTNKGISFGDLSTETAEETFEEKFSIGTNGFRFGQGNSETYFISLSSNKATFSGDGDFNQLSGEEVSVGESGIISKNQKTLKLKVNENNNIELKQGSVSITSPATKITEKLFLGSNLEYRPNGDYYDLYVF